VNKASNIRQGIAANKGSGKPNTSGFIGVKKHKLCTKFEARVVRNGKEKYLGLFDTAKEASDARTAYILATEAAAKSAAATTGEGA
jgi:hypothetical protein